jgi:hypothetical protein
MFVNITISMFRVLTWRRRMSTGLLYRSLPMRYAARRLLYLARPLWKNEDVGGVKGC